MKRTSTESLARLGATPSIVYDGNSAVVKFTNSAGTNNGNATGNIEYDIPPGISADKYSYLLSFFQHKVPTIENAKVLLQVHLDAALIYNTDPIEMLNQYAFSPDNSFYLDLENLFRTVGTKLGYVTQNTNINSKVARQVRA